MRFRLARIAGRLLVAAGLVAAVVGVDPASAAESPVGLGTASSFAVLAGSTVTNTGPSVISGDVGVSPGTAVTGFPPGTVSNGTIHAADAVAAQAQLDVTTAYNDAAGRSPTATVTADLGGQTLVSGVYSGPTLGLTGALTLDAQGDPTAVFIFQAGSTLISASSSVVTLVNGAQACNVFWQVGSSATLGTNSVFVGTVLALTSVTANTGASVSGRLLARNAAVTLDSNTITQSGCVTPSTTTTTTAPTTTESVTGTTTMRTDTGGVPGSDTEGGTPRGGVPSGPGTTGGATPSLPATGAQLTALAVYGLLSIAVGTLMLLASRQGRAL